MRFAFAPIAFALFVPMLFAQGPPAEGKIIVVDLGGNVKLEMVKINAKGKKFLMGSPKEEAGRNPYEMKFDAEALHEVSFNHDFFLGKFEVTQEQYEAIVGTNPSYFKGAKNPVETVSWDDAQAFVKKLNAKFKDRMLTFRLPSEAEWEYACRAGTTTPFHFGKELNGKQANSDGTVPYGTTVKGPYLQKTISVGSYDANAFGLHDMHGNVYEWCEDYYGEYKAAPKDGIAQKIKQSNDVRVLRGGSWYNGSRGCRSADRFDVASDFRDNVVGFRVAVTPQE